MAETGEEEGVVIYFNPFLFTVEENNEMIRLGYVPMPMSIPQN